MSTCLSEQIIRSYRMILSFSFCYLFVFLVSGGLHHSIAVLAGATDTPFIRRIEQPVCLYGRIKNCL